MLTAEELTHIPEVTLLEKNLAEMTSRAGMKVPDVIVHHVSSGLNAVSDDIITINAADFKRFSSDELHGAAGHELGHIRRKDYLNSARPNNHAQEFAADRLGVDFSQKPEALASYLSKIARDEPYAAKGNKTYPPIEERIKRILEYGKAKGFIHDSQAVQELQR